MINFYKRAEEAAAIYSQNPKVKAIMLAGSVSRGWQDAFSDIEIHIFWSADPSDEDRKSAIQQLNGEILSYFDYEEEEWSESYIVDGIKIEISSFRIETVEKVIEHVTEDFSTSLDEQALLSAIEAGEALYGHDDIESMKQKIAVYPDELAKAMIQERLEMGARWMNRAGLVHRKDYVLLYSTITHVQHNLLGMLHALNGMYVQHPGFKWLHRTIGQMTIAPEIAAERFERVFTVEAPEAVSIMDYLIRDVYDLVEARYPDLDVETYRKKTEIVKGNTHWKQ
ncbi:DUF4037 domain-containing protein [Fictibacillus iocasae]|uniref:DUF4037 domain-containing protein n=1 Tax=Fictibacillus iocasae TaxID=2715437 RepID=A0ABW2NU64_9BACL